MTYYVIIPAHNEAAYLGQTLSSLVAQSLLPKKIVVVNDNSTDSTQQIIAHYTAQYAFIEGLEVRSSLDHIPGSKVIHAFNKGLALLDEQYDFVVKLDADLILPPNYFEKIALAFKGNPKIGIAGGFIHEQNEKGTWARNHPMDRDHVRGAIKAYGKACFKAIGGLKEAMGWDTVDELLARYHGFETYTDPDLPVKHLRPTGMAYDPKAKLLQGQAMYRMRYGFWISLVAALKMAIKQKRWAVFTDGMYGYLDARKKQLPFMVSPKEGQFIRAYRWRKIGKKIMP